MIYILCCLCPFNSYYILEKLGHSNFLIVFNMTDFVFLTPFSLIFDPYLTFQVYCGQVILSQWYVFHWEGYLPTYTAYWKSLRATATLFSSISSKLSKSAKNSYFYIKIVNFELIRVNSYQHQILIQCKSVLQHSTILMQLKIYDISSYL